MSTSSRRSSWQDHHHHRPRHHHTPSFSSSLLEEIYRSFDQETTDNHHHHLLNNTDHMTYRTKQSKTSSSSDRTYLEAQIPAKFRRASMSEATFRRQANHYSSSTSSSSESCSSGTCGFSSSETESLYRSSSRKIHQNPLPPIRTAANPPEIRRNFEVPPAKKKKEGNLHRKALKLYGDLKKVKQPISPGGKLTAFLNSLFNSKQKINISLSSTNGVSNMERESPSTASRSCLSKTPSSAGGRFETRSVRFVDEEIRHVRRTSADVAKRDSSMLLASDVEFREQIREKQRRVEEMAKELLKTYHHHHQSRRDQSTADITSDHHHRYDHDRKFGYRYDLERELEDDEDDNDDMSCCSSDLFELENWLEIGADHQRYREELPVYETTRFDPANRAFAI